MAHFDGQTCINSRDVMRHHNGYYYYNGALFKFTAEGKLTMMFQNELPGVKCLNTNGDGCWKGPCDQPIQAPSWEVNFVGKGNDNRGTVLHYFQLVARFENAHMKAYDGKCLKTMPTVHWQYKDPLGLRDCGDGTDDDTLFYSLDESFALEVSFNHKPGHHMQRGDVWDLVALTP
jgi:hypothetical protein